MKKVVRSVWICALTGLAFLAACISQNGLTRAQRRHLTKERDALVVRIDQLENMMVEGTVDYGLLEEEISCYYELAYINRQLTGVEDTVSLKKWREIYDIIWDRPIPVLYGSPTTDSLSTESEVIIIDEKYQRRLELERKLNAINETLNGREGATLYGSPEFIQSYDEETRRIKQEAKQIQQQLKDLDND